jgi:hypothetical protein
MARGAAVAPLRTPRTGAPPDLRLVRRPTEPRRVPWRAVVAVVAIVAALGVIAGRVMAQRLAIEVQHLESLLAAATIHHGDLVASVSSLASPSYTEAVATAHGFVHPTWEELSSSSGAPEPASALGAPTGEAAPLPAGTVSRG